MKVFSLSFIFLKFVSSNYSEILGEWRQCDILDMTLPRTKDFICPNQKCETNKNYSDKNREAVFYRPSSDSYNLKYICCFCKTSWSPYFQTTSSK